MICEACNKQIRDGAKFCGQCGAKAQLAPSLSTGGSSVQKYELRTLSVNATGPDSDGDLSVEIKVAITNRSGADWDQVNTRTQLISASGFIEETSDSHDLVVEDGETEEFEVNFYGVKARPFLANPELTKTIINVVACSASSKKLGDFALPEAAFEVVKIETCDVSDSVKLLGAGIWRTEPDDDKDVRVESKWLVQNITDTHLPEVRFTAEVISKSGDEIGDAGGYEELRQRTTTVVNGSTYSKEKKLKGATVKVVARLMLPAVIGSKNHIGLMLLASDDAANNNEMDVDECTLDGLFSLSKCRENSDKFDVLMKDIGFGDKNIMGSYVKGDPFYDSTGNVGLEGAWGENLSTNRKEKTEKIVAALTSFQDDPDIFSLWKYAILSKTAYMEDLNESPQIDWPSPWAMLETVGKTIDQCLEFMDLTNEHFNSKRISEQYYSYAMASLISCYFALACTDIDGGNTLIGKLLRLICQNKSMDGVRIDGDLLYGDGEHMEFFRRVIEELSGQRVVRPIGVDYDKDSYLDNTDWDEVADKIFNNLV